MKTNAILLVLGLAWTQSAFAGAVHAVREIDRLLGAARSPNYMAAPGACAVEPEVEVGCSALMEDFCKDLHSDGKDGNIDLPVKDGSTRVRLGNAANGISEPMVAMVRAKIAAADRLPEDLAKRLRSKDPVSGKNYFEHAKGYLEIPSPENSSLEQVTASKRMLNAMSVAWQLSFDETVRERTAARYPEYWKLRDLPPEVQVFQNRVTRELTAETFRSIWEQHPRWQKVQREYDELKARYAEVLAKDPKFGSLPADVRQTWVEQVRTLELEIPSSDPMALNEECATIEQNAEYSPERHRTTVCAGDFNTIDVHQGLVHEIGHAVGSHRMKHLFLQKSALFAKLKAVREQICSAKGTVRACPPDYAQFKAGLKADLAELGRYRYTALQKFRECLSYNDITGVPTATALADAGEAEARGQAGALADDDLFLKLTKPAVPMPGGASAPNPMYLNPCGEEDWAEHDYTLENSWNLEFLFVAEYLCGPQGASPAERLDQSIDRAVGVHASILAKTIPMSGRFADSRWMIESGFSEDVEERFADGVGLYVWSTLLTDPKLGTLDERRNLYLSNISWTCGRASLSELYPDEAQAQKKHSLEPHSDLRHRRYEFLSAPIRSALECTKDFTMKDCEL
jgi:hypothetical protein